MKDQIELCLVVETWKSKLVGKKKAWEVRDHLSPQIFFLISKNKKYPSGEKDEPLAIPNVPIYVTSNYVQFYEFQLAQLVKSFIIE